MTGNDIWLANDQVSRGAEVGPDGVPALTGLVNRATGHDWALRGAPCGVGVAFGQPDASEAASEAPASEGWRFVRSGTAPSEGGAVRSTVTLDHESGLRVAQSAVCFPGMAVIEHRCKVSNEGDRVVRGLSRFDPLSLPIAHASGLTVHAVRRDRYELQSLPLPPGEPFVIRGGEWNKPEHAGWFMLENVEAKEFLYVGIEWEREWELALRPTAGGWTLSAGVVQYSRDLAPGEAVESPRIFIGLAHGDRDDAVHEMHRYLAAHVFPSAHAGFPWVTYDIWSTDKEDVEAILLREVEFAADMGVELFYIDASWWAGSSVLGEGSWGLGLGNYDEDRRKFPRGLNYIAERARARGMKFGLWVDPVVIDEQWVLNGKIARGWLVSKDGAEAQLNIQSGDWPRVFQLCTGCPEVVEYLYETLAALVERYRLDWLKWDDSALSAPYCNREDHGHQAGDGNFSALAGKYDICARLMNRFPNLVIEQCGYPARLDYGLARYSRSNWLSDATNNSGHVRSNLDVTGHVFPASYNTTFLVWDAEILEETRPEKLDTIVRSRMMGLFGLATLHGKLAERVSLWPEPVIEAIRRNVKEYKTYRHLFSQRAFRLTDGDRRQDGMYAKSFVSEDAGEAVLFCFPEAAEHREWSTVRLKGLIPGKRYRLRSVNTGEVTAASGRELMEQGVAIRWEHEGMSEIIVLT